MPYILCVFNEVGRMYGPGTGVFAREVITEHEINHIPIAKGSLVGTMLLPNNYNPKYYTDPFKFNPERWMSEGNSVIHPFMFIPFSSGARNCIGQHLAILEAKIVLIKLLSRYELTIEKPDEIHLKLGFLASPTQFKTTVVRRSEQIVSDEELTV
jgi:cytochrome P450